MDLELHKELEEINSKLATLTALAPIIERHDEVIYGRSDSEIGLITRLDRIEQRAKSHKWILGIALTALFANLTDWIKRVFE